MRRSTSSWSGRMPAAITTVSAGKDTPVGENVVVVGGGLIGSEEAVALAREGHKVTILEMQDLLAPDAMRTYQEELVGQVGDHCSAAITGAKVTAITDTGVVYVDKGGVEHTVPADTVLLAVGMKPRAAEAETFRPCAERFRKLGDCVKVGNVKTVTRAAFDAAMTIGAY